MVSLVSTDNSSIQVVPIGNKGNFKRRCVLSLGIGRSHYKLTLERLGQSLQRVGFDGDYLYWNHDYPSGCPEHLQAPFAFKPYCFYRAIQLGYQQLLWIDAPCVAIRSLEPVFRLLESNGYIFFNNNYSQKLGQWASDQSLAANGVSREEALMIPELPCSVLGLDLRSTLAQKFLAEWHRIMNDGITARGTATALQDWDAYQAMFWNRNGCISSDPRVKGHRCDQVAAGLTAHRLGMTPYADLLRDIHYPQRPIKTSTAILHYREYGDTITQLNTIYRQVFFTTPFVERPKRLLHPLKRLLGTTLRTASKTLRPGPTGP